METIKYTIIKDKAQYLKYCDFLEDLVVQDDKKNNDEIELLTLLIEKWDADNNTFGELNPIELIKSF